MILFIVDILSLQTHYNVDRNLLCIKKLVDFAILAVSAELCYPTG